MQKYSKETDCLEYFRTIREKLGMSCNHCGCTDFKWFIGKSHFECKNCGNSKYIYEGTILENSELPIKYWFIAIHLLTSANGRIDPLIIQKQFGKDNEKAVINMFNKLYKAMKKTGCQYEFEELLIACVTNDKKIRTIAG